MAKLTTTPDFPKLIEVTDFDMTRAGCEVFYNLFGEEQHLEADSLGTAQMFKKAGYITNYAGRGENLMIQAEVTYSYVDDSGDLVEAYRKENRTWVGFVADYTMNKHMALELAVLHEREKCGASENVFLEVLRRIEATDKNVKLTGQEQKVFDLIGQASQRTFWGLAIHGVKAVGSAMLIKLLLKELRESAHEDPQMMRLLLGDEAFDSLIKL